MVTHTTIAVAEVLGLGHLNEVRFLVHLWHRCPLVAALDNESWQLIDVVQSFAFAGHSWLHGLESSGEFLIGGQLVVAATLDTVLRLHVNLEDRSESLNLVSLFVGGGPVNGQVLDGAILQEDLEGFGVLEGHLLEGQFVLVEMSFGSLGQNIINSRVFGLLNLGHQVVLALWLD